MRSGSISSSKSREALLPGYARGTASRMNFGKFAFGALILAIGVLLLAVRTGFAHPDTPILLLRYWPLLLIAFGLAFLAGAIKNPFLGCFAIFLILGGTALGMFWMNRQEKQGTLEHAASSRDLAKTGAASLSVRVHTLAGSLDLGASAPGSSALSIALRGAPGDSAEGYRLTIEAKKAILTWPREEGFALPPLGAQVTVRAPETWPLTLRWSGWLASMHADFERLKPSRCDLHEVFSSGRITWDDAGRPGEIRVWGVASILRIRIPADCPVRVISESPYVFRSLPSDFEEHAQGRGRDRVDAAAGRGSPVRIYVGGFMQIKVERMPLTTVTTQAGRTREDTEWPRRIATASPFHSRSS